MKLTIDTNSSRRCLNILPHSNVYGVVGLNNVTTDYGGSTQMRYKF